MKKEILRVNNNEKTVSVYQKDFEENFSAVEKKIEMYQKIGYELKIENNPKKVSETQKMNRDYMINSLLPESEEFGFTEEESKKYLDMFKTLLDVGFQTAKGYFIRLLKAKRDDKPTRTVEEVYNYYFNLYASKIA